MIATRHVQTSPAAVLRAVAEGDKRETTRMHPRLGSPEVRQELRQGGPWLPAARQVQAPAMALLHEWQSFTFFQRSLNLGTSLAGAVVSSNPCLSVTSLLQDTPTIPSHREVRITGMPGEAVNVHFELHARLKVERII